MTHTQTQGADGAGPASDIGPIPVLYTNWRGETAVRRIIVSSPHLNLRTFWLGSSEWHPERQWLFSAYDLEKQTYRDFAFAGIKAWGQAAVDAALAASTPASTIPPGVRSLLRTARSGLATYGAGAFEGTILQIDAILANDPIFPAPAATPGVPDSVRALSEAATQGEWVFERMHDDFVGVYSDDRTGSVIANFAGFHAAPRPKTEQDANARLAAEAVNHVRALIVAQPAGQAGDPSCDFQMMLARLISRHSKGLDITQTIEGARDLLKRKGTLSPLREEPAPNCTRTGAAETGAEEADASVPSHILAMAQAMADGRARAWESMRYGACVPQHHSRSYWVMIAQDAYAALAARPEAPSDAGWNFDMEAAPQDGTRILLWMHGCWIHPVIGYRAPSAPGSQRDCWREHGSRARIHRVDCWRLIPAGPIPPSDPAPSGQAEGPKLALREGAYYRKGDGQKVGPMFWWNNAWYAKGQPGDWNSHGENLHGLPSKHPKAAEYDLVSEWQED